MPNPINMLLKIRDRHFLCLSSFSKSSFAESVINLFALLFLILQYRLKIWKRDFQNLFSLGRLFNTDRRMTRTEAVTRSRSRRRILFVSRIWASSTWDTVCISDFDKLILIWWFDKGLKPFIVCYFPSCSKKALHSKGIKNSAIKNCLFWFLF